MFQGILIVKENECGVCRYHTHTHTHTHIQTHITHTHTQTHTHHTPHTHTHTPAQMNLKICAVEFEKRMDTARTCLLRALLVSRSETVVRNMLRICKFFLQTHTVDTAAAELRSCVTRRLQMTHRLYAQCQGVQVCGNGKKTGDR